MLSQLVAAGKTYRRPHNVHAMAASIKELLKLDKAHHFLSPSSTDDCRWKQAGNSLHHFPHLHRDK